MNEPTTESAAVVSNAEKRWVTVSAALVATVYALLALSRVWTMRANAFDAGFIDNVLWKVSQGLGDVSGLTGLNHFVDHASPLLLLAVPLYWVAPSQAYLALITVQAASVVVVAVSAWLIARALNLDAQTRMVVYVFVLLNAGLWWAAVADAHMAGLSLGLLAMAIAGAFRQWSLRWYWVLPVLASAARIEIAIGVLIAGLVVMPVAKNHARLCAGVGSAATVVLGLWMMLSSQEGSSFGGHFAYLGVDSMADVPLALATSPGLLMSEIGSRRLWMSVAIWIVFVGIVLPIRGKRWFLVAAPLLAVPVLGGHHPADLWFEHYWTVLIVSAAVAIPVSLQRTGWTLRFVGPVAAVALLLGWMIAGPHIGPTDRQPFPLAVSAGARETVEFLSANKETVALPSSLVLPLSAREWVYRFPNPFVCRIDQDAVFNQVGPAPEFVVLSSDWWQLIGGIDRPTVEAVIEQHYRAVANFGQFSVFERVPGATPPMIQMCRVASSLESAEELR